MKHTIHSFSQARAIDLGLNVEDLLFLRWFIDFRDTDGMERKYVKNINNMGYWTKYKKIAEDLPILFSGTDEANKKKIQRMLSGNLSKILTRQFEATRKENGEVKGGRIYLALIPEVYQTLIKSEEKKDESKENQGVSPTGQKCPEGYGQKCPEGMDKNVHADISIRDITINDIYIEREHAHASNSNPVNNVDNVDKSVEKEEDPITKLFKANLRKQFMDLTGIEISDKQLNILAEMYNADSEYTYKKILEFKKRAGRSWSYFYSLHQTPTKY